MEVIVVPNAVAGARMIADLVVKIVTAKPSAVLGLATGSSPAATYSELIRRHRARDVTFAQCTAFLLDEYLGLLRTDDRCYANVIEEMFTRHVDFAPSAVRAPDTETADPNAEAISYDQSIRDAGGIDLQLLGIGTDGHIGFNEPISSLTSRTRVKTLTGQSILDNASWFGEDVPNHVITQGIGTILESKHAILIANGTHKSEAIASAVEGPLSAFVPASALQLHPHATVVIDEAAASKLTLLNYYRDIQNLKVHLQPEIT